MIYNIYTDGACSGNPGPGGYAFIILNELNSEPVLKLSGHKKNTTNNEMELLSVVRAIKHLQDIMVQKVVNTIYVHSDSAYIVNSINNNWIDFWEKNNWYTKGGTKVKHSELWAQLASMLRNKYCHIRFMKVKGHSGDLYNELVDKAAVAAIRRVNGEK